MKLISCDNTPSCKLAVRPQKMAHSRPWKNFHLARPFPTIGLIGNCWISEVHIFLLDVDVFFSQLVDGGWFHVALKTLRGSSVWG